MRTRWDDPADVREKRREERKEARIRAIRAGRITRPVPLRPTDWDRLGDAIEALRCELERRYWTFEGGEKWPPSADAVERDVLESLLDSLDAAAGSPRGAPWPTLPQVDDEGEIATPLQELDMEEIREAVTNYREFAQHLHFYGSEILLELLDDEERAEFDRAETRLALSIARPAGWDRYWRELAEERRADE